MVPVARAFWKACAVSFAQNGFARVFHEDQFALDNEHEFVFLTVPMTLTRPAPRRKCHQVHPEVSQADCIAQALSRALCARLIERLRITRANAHWNCREID